MAGTFLTALSCIQEHQLAVSAVALEDEDDVDESRVTRYLEDRMRRVNPSTGEENNEDANEGESVAERSLEGTEKCASEMEFHGKRITN